MSDVCKLPVTGKLLGVGGRVVGGHDISLVTSGLFWVCSNIGINVKAF